jgi:enoyl-CoA hydratase
MKVIVNQAYENMGLRSTQHLGSLLDGMLRNTPEALRFIEAAETDGVPAAVAQRDDPFGDYSRGPRDAKPDPANSYPAPARRPS